MPHRELREILQDYDDAIELRESKPIINHIITRFNQKILWEIRRLNPCYLGTTCYKPPEIYPDERDHQTIDEWYESLFDLWTQAPYQYKIPNVDRERICQIVHQEFTRDYFRKMAEACEQAEKDFTISSNRLIEEYANHPGKDMNSLCSKYIRELKRSGNRDAHCNILRGLEREYIRNKCKLILVEKSNTPP